MEQGIYGMPKRVVDGVMAYLAKQGKLGKLIRSMGYRPLEGSNSSLMQV